MKTSIKIILTRRIKDWAIKKEIPMSSKQLSSVVDNIMNNGTHLKNT